MDDRQQVQGGIKSQFGHTYQVMPPDISVHYNVSVGGSSVAQDVTNAQAIRFASLQDCYILFGNSSVVAAPSTSILHTAGVEVYAVPKDATNIAYIQVTTTGVASITKMGEG